MAVEIRLARHGAKGKPFYRIVVADARSPRDGKFIDRVGHYDPRKEPSEIKVDAEKAREWLRKGAQPTDQVRNLLKISGVLQEEKR
ncbi:MAG: 30S ribosomal protein S16 [Rubrobacter sp.]|nr:30S ribosomal protein S16 [Rubrobacter sp.]